MKVSSVKDLKIKLLTLRLSTSMGNDIDRKKKAALKKEISVLLTKINSVKQ
jgi:ribosomal protein L29